jgi:general stress protein 26
VAVFGSSGIGTSGSATKKNSQLIVGIKHSNVVCIYINGTDDKTVRTAMGTAECSDQGVFLKQS